MRRPAPPPKPPTTHPDPAAGTSQADRVLERLRRAGGEWMGLPELERASGSHVVHSRIADLRKRGHRIEHKNEFRAEGGRRVCHSRYRLTRDADPPQQSLF